MPKTPTRYRRRRATPFYRATEFLRTAALKAKMFFFALNLRGRVLAGGVCMLLLAGVCLLVFSPKKTTEETPALAARQAQGESIMLAEGTGDDAMVLSALITPAPTPTPTPPPPTPTPVPTLERGATGEAVTELQARLMDLGYLDIDEPTDLFGPATKDAVQRFQRQHADSHGLDQDGRAGALTQEALFSSEAKKYVLMQGTDGSDVENFQQQLKELGYLSKVTGHYGDETIAAVKAFQERNGLSADGKAGEKTFDLINSDKAKPSPNVAKQTRTKANIDKMIATAKEQLGDKYILGNTGPNSFDCSGLVYYCLKAAGSNRRRLNAAGYSAVSDWEKISFSNIKKGDLVFFYNNAKTKVGHVGIYIGGGEMIDASSKNGKVVRRSVSTSYWKTHFVCARRPW